jgi:hypothetical protein
MLIAASEMRSQKSSRKGNNDQGSQAFLMFPSSLEACTRTIRSIAAAAQAPAAAESMFEAHAAETHTSEPHGDEECVLIDNSCTRMTVAMPHSSFKLDSRFGVEQNVRRHGRILPFRSVEPFFGLMNATNT